MKKVDLTEGKVLTVLLALALPIMGSSVLQLTYSLVDMLLVGRLGSDAVASIGTSSFLIGIGTAINTCVVIGTGIKVSHALGKKDEQEQQDYINAGFRLNFLIGIIFAMILIFTGKAFISFLDVENAYVEVEGYKYLLVSAPMVFFSFFNFWYTRLYNSFGQNKAALKISALGVLLNIVLDPIFIYTLKLGVMGAGLATLIANAFMSGLFFKQSRTLIKLDYKLKIKQSVYWDIISLGLPMSTQRILFTLVSIVLAKMIAVFGTNAIAAQKIGLQIESITYMVIGGLNGAIASFVGQNYGAKAYERIQSGMKVAMCLGVGYSLLTTMVFLFIPDSLASLFVSEQQTIQMTADYLKLVGLTQLFMAVEIICNGAFVGMGLPKIPAMIGISFTLLRIPMAYFFIQWIGVNGIWMSISLSMLFKGIVAFRIYCKKEKEGNWYVNAAKVTP